MTFELIAMNYGGVFNLQTLLRALVSCQSKNLNLPVKPIKDWKNDEQQSCKLYHRSCTCQQYEKKTKFEKAQTKSLKFLFYEIHPPTPHSCSSMNQQRKSFIRLNVATRLLVIVVVLILLRRGTKQCFVASFVCGGVGVQYVFVMFVF